MSQTTSTGTEDDQISSSDNYEQEPSSCKSPEQCPWEYYENILIKILYSLSTKKEALITCSHSSVLVRGTATLANSFLHSNHLLP